MTWNLAGIGFCICMAVVGVAAMLHTLYVERRKRPVAKPVVEAAAKAKILVSEELDHAAMRAILPFDKCNSVGVELGCVGQSDIDRQRYAIVKLHDWLSTQEDRVVVRAYTRWISYLERNVAESQRALDSGARQRWLDSSERRRQEYADLQSRAAALDIPRPKL